MRRVARVAGAAFLAWAPLWAHAADDGYIRLRQLVDQKNFSDAYALAETLSGKSAGQASFDYLYGLAALETGHTGVAVFALERVLMTEPANDAARIALGRAYQRDGRADLARAMLNTVLARSGDEALADQARAQLAAQPLPAPATRWDGSIGLSAGYDSNVNATTDLEQLPPPPATILILDPGARARDDSYMRLSFDVNAERPAGTRGILFAGANGYENLNVHEHDFDTTHLGLLGGGGIEHESSRTLLYLTYQQLLLDHSAYLTVAGPGAEWQWRPDPDRRLSVSAFYAGYRYASFAQHDTGAWVAALAWYQRFRARGAPQLNVVLHAGNEQPRDALYDYFGRTYYGFEADLSINPAPRHTPYLAARWQTSEYDGVDPVYATARTDNYWRASLGWRYRFRPQTDIGIEIEHTRNDSDIVLYSFRRTRGFVTLRYLWR